MFLLVQSSGEFVLLRYACKMVTKIKISWSAVVKCDSTFFNSNLKSKTIHGKFLLEFYVAHDNKCNIRTSPSTDQLVEFKWIIA